MMRTLTYAAIAAVTMLSATPASAAATDSAQTGSSRSVDARASKVQLGGVINVHVRYGTTPSLTLFGEKDDLARISVRQNGDTLSIDTTGRNWSFGPSRQRELRAELVLPTLTEFTSQGVGSTIIDGYTGTQLRVTLGGAGAMMVSGHYKTVTATLGGVGNLMLDAGEAERIELNLHGAGHIEVKGQSALLKANLSGVGGLEARELRAAAVQLDLSGLGGASVFASTSADVNLSGLGSATVYGKPATRHANARGLGSIAWQ